MWSKKWCLKRNISCDVHVLNELLETDVPWDDAIVVLAGKLRKLWDYLSELRSSVCETRLESTVLRPALLPVKTAQFPQFFRHVWLHTVKSLSLTKKHWQQYNTHENLRLSPRNVFDTLSFTVFTCVRKISKRDYSISHVCLSVCPHGTTLLPLDGSSWNLIFEYFSKICRENSSFTQIRQI
jgi:hypothetical protein